MQSAGRQVSVFVHRDIQLLSVAERVVVLAVGAGVGEKGLTEEHTAQFSYKPAVGKWRLFLVVLFVYSSCRSHYS